MGQVDGFISQLQAGIDDCDTSISDKADKIEEIAVEIDTLELERVAGQTLLNNLTQLKGQ